MKSGMFVSSRHWWRDGTRHHFAWIYGILSVREGALVQAEGFGPFAFQKDEKKLNFFYFFHRIKGQLHEAFMSSYSYNQDTSNLAKRSHEVR